MRSRVRGVTTVVATVAVVAFLSLAVGPIVGQGQAPVPGQFPAYRAPRAADGKADLNGIWQALVPANIDVLDHDAQAGPHPEIMGAYGSWPGGQ